MPDTIGYRFKIFRETLGVTQAVFAENIGLSSAAIGLLEKDKSFLKAENLKKLIVLYNLNINWLLTGQGKMFLESNNSFEIKYEPLKIDKYELGKRVNKIRIDTNLNSNQMAEIIELTEKEFAALCMGELKLTPEVLLKLVQKICENFNVTADWLLFGKE